MRTRRIKNWYTAMAILFAVMAVIVILRDLALLGAGTLALRFNNEQINNEKISLIMFGIAAVLFAVGVRKSGQLYQKGEGL